MRGNHTVDVLLIGCDQGIGVGGLTATLCHYPIDIIDAIDKPGVDNVIDIPYNQYFVIKSYSDHNMPELKQCLVKPIIKTYNKGIINSLHYLDPQGHKDYLSHNHLSRNRKSYVHRRK
ncbi:MAG TPA: hypothetical protein PLW93_00540 [Candidatus Absconditabacterales bacterium]|nr:hypothetical protein [Candidatus Absconditabacterales bacterium]HNG96739.1 hypothetical protein [Candidatus Absconditabacterales bacterium]